MVISKGGISLNSGDLAGVIVFNEELQNIKAAEFYVFL